MSNILRGKNGCYVLLHSDGWFEILTPGDNGEKGKPHIATLVIEYLGNLEFHTFAVRQRGAFTYSCIELHSEVDYQSLPIVQPLICMEEE